MGRKSDLFERRARARPGQVGREARDGQRQQDVGNRASVIQQVSILKDDTHGAAQVGLCPGGKLVEALAVDLDCSPGTRLKSANHFEQRGFAGA